MERIDTKTTKLLAGEYVMVEDWLWKPNDGGVNRSFFGDLFEVVHHDGPYAIVIQKTDSFLADDSQWTFKLSEMVLVRPGKEFVAIKLDAERQKRRRREEERAKREAQALNEATKRSPGVFAGLTN